MTWELYSESLEYLYHFLLPRSEIGRLMFKPELGRLLMLVLAWDG